MSSEAALLEEGSAGYRGTLRSTCSRNVRCKSSVRNCARDLVLSTSCLVSQARLACVIPHRRFDNPSQLWASEATDIGTPAFFASRHAVSSRSSR